MRYESNREKGLHFLTILVVFLADSFPSKLQELVVLHKT